MKLSVINEILRLKDYPGQSVYNPTEMGVHTFISLIHQTNSVD